MIIRVIDLETTGFEPPAAVCELGWSDLVEAGDRWLVKQPAEVFINPGQPIPPATSAIHHIVDADVARAPDWDTAAPPVFAAAGVVAFAAHNARFEQQWCAALTGATPWICTYKCGLRLWPEAPSHSNGTLRYWRNPAGLDRTVAMLSHRAGPDAYVTAFLLRDMLALAPMADLIKWSAEPARLVRCSFGKHRGVLWTDVPSDYLSWVVRQDMDADVLFTARSEIERRAKAARS